jgi:hypothetical protein
VAEAMKRSNADQQAIETCIGQLKGLVEKPEPHDGLNGLDLYEAILQCCNQLRIKLVSRVQALQLLASRSLASFINLCAVL